MQCCSTYGRPWMCVLFRKQRVTDSNIRIIVNNGVYNCSMCGCADINKNKILKSQTIRALFLVLFWLDKLEIFVEIGTTS